MINRFKLLVAKLIESLQVAWMTVCLVCSILWKNARGK